MIGESRVERPRAGPPRRRVWRWAGALAVTLPLWLGSAWAATELRAEARLGGGYDSNVFESVSASKRVSDSYGLLELGLSLESHSRAIRRGPQASLRWASERFVSERLETRHILWGEFGWRWANRRRALEVSAGAMRRTFPADWERDVSRYEIAAAAGLRAGERGRISLQAAGVTVRTKPDGPAQRRGWRGSGEYRQAFGGHWQLFGRLEGGAIRYERDIRGECPPGHLIGPFDRQDDDTYLGGVGIARSGSPLMQFFYGFRVTESNVTSLSHERHELQLHAGWLLPARVSAQLLVRWNFTSYRNADCSAILPGEDPEDPDLWEQNSIVLQLRRPLRGAISAEIRGGWQRNEALIPGRHYDKATIQAGLSYSAGSRR